MFERIFPKTQKFKQVNKYFEVNTNADNVVKIMIIIRAGITLTILDFFFFK